MESWCLKTIVPRNVQFEELKRDTHLVTAIDPDTPPIHDDELADH